MVTFRKSVLFIALLASLGVLSALAAGWTHKASAELKPLPYIGKWSNGRGDTLAISASTIRFGSDKAVNYRDVTKATNGQEYNLEVVSLGKLNYLTKYLQISTGDGDKPDEMKMTLYDSYKDMEDGENSQGEASWYRDQ
jgi:hypothetical protein